MSAKSVSVLATATLALFISASALAQSPYFNAITNLNPVGYWPMHEVEAAARGDIETNYGTLGLLGTAYYPDWVSANPPIKHGYPGALTGDSDTATYFTFAQGTGSTVRWTNGLYVPHTSPWATLNPPFSVECWVWPSNSTAGGILGQEGFEGLNAGAAGGGGGAVDGLTLLWNGTGFRVYQYYSSSSFNNNLGANSAVPIGQWCHVVLTCDASTNETLYINGTNFATFAAAGIYTPDYWSPFEIGGSRGNTRLFQGVIDEVAVYTNELSALQVTNHYAAAFDPLDYGAYETNVLADSPVIYLRMDSSAYIAPARGTWPVLTNYGSVAVNGAFNPGTMPGLASGPASPNAVPFSGVSGNVAQLSGISSFADAGYSTAYNPTGAVAFSVAAMFRGNPCDNRIQAIVGHSDNSWRIVMNTNGALLCQLGTNTASTINSAGVYNDGQWHQVVEVYSPASNANIPGTNALYVDGALDSLVTIVSTNGIGPGSTQDLMIGADPQYTNNPAGVGRQFAGQICEVAVFTNALTASQVQTLYTVSGTEESPEIILQPTTGRTVNGGSGTYIYIGVVANGTLPLAYQWYFNASPTYDGATQLINGTHYSNATTSQVTVTNLADTDNGYYFVVITNNYGSVTSALASLTVNLAPAIISQLPIPYTNLFTLYAGTSPAFSISAEGSEPLYYLWYTNGVLDLAATNPDLTLTNVQSNFSSYCIVSNSTGTATSMVWSATVIASPTAAYPTNVLALNPVGYWRLNEPDNGDSDGDADVLCHDYVGGNDGIYTNVNLGQTGYSSTDPETSTLFGETGLTPLPIDSYAGQIQGVDFAATNGATANFTVEAWVEGVEQQIPAASILSKGIYSVNEAWSMDFDTTASRHYRFYVRTANGTIVTCTSSLASDSYTWHHVVGVCDETDGVVNFYIDGRLAASAAIGTTAGAFESSGYPIQIGSAISNAAPTASSTLQFYGYINDVAAYNYALTASQVAQQYVSIGVPPYFTQTPPATMTLTAGGTLILPATAYGTTPVSYLWHDVNANTNVVTGSTNGLPLNATLTVSNVPGTWNGDQLTLTVNNGNGSTNVTVTLTVLTGTPVIANNLPSRVILVSGKPYTYSIGVTGPSPYFYQWYNGATPITGQTNATYSLTAGAPGSTTYYVVVTNVYGADTSTVSTFTSVSSPPPLTTAYATNVLQLNPVAYWPMHEVEAAAVGDIETNYGTLGLLGTGFYADWEDTNGLIQRGATGAFGPGEDTAVNFDFPLSNAGSTTNALYVPHTSPLSTLNPPFSVECWAYANGGNAGDVWSQNGYEGLNAGTEGNGDGAVCGIRLYWNGGGFTVYNFDNSSTFNNEPRATSLSAGNWYHVVVTCDANLNEAIWVNGSQVGTYAAAGKYAPDYWSPFSVGNGHGNNRAFDGMVDEVAVYTNVLTDIATHYNDGINSGANAYFNDVTNDNPVIYLRMDSSAYGAPPLASWPTLTNDGSAGVFGIYSPGTMPGIVPGPAISGLSGSSVAQLSGVSSFADVGYAPAYNPVGAVPFSVAAMFRGNPADGRTQTIVGHSDNSWGLLLNTSGNLVWQLTTNASLPSVGIYNDGNWHQAVAVYTPSSDPTVPGTSSLYVDGVLDTNNTSISTNGIVSGSSSDVMIGSDPQYVNNPAGLGRQFAGQICEVALFTNALTAAQVQQLYNATTSVTVNTNPTNIVYSVTNGLLMLSWPADHIGWQLQAQTNSVKVGINANWVNVSGSSSTDQIVVPINLTNGSVFYRLVYP